MGQVAISRVDVPAEKLQPAERYAKLPVRNEIDKLVYARLQKVGYLPSDTCSDAEFLRRTSLDAIGMLPSVDRFKQEVAKAGLKLVDMSAFGLSYADTLARWTERFKAAWSDVQKLGFDERFKRMWLFYLSYCEAGFRSKRTDVVQAALVR
jgi:hypothetical protein